MRKGLARARGGNKAGGGGPAPRSTRTRRGTRGGRACWAAALAAAALLAQARAPTAVATAAAMAGAWRGVVVGGGVFFCWSRERKEGRRRGGDELSVDVFRAAPQFAFRPPFRRCFGLLPMLLVSYGNVTEPFQGGENSGKRANGGPWQRALAKGLAKPRRRRQSPSRRIGPRTRKKKRHHFFHSYLGSHSRRDADGAYHDDEKFFLAWDREGSERAAEREAAKDELRSRAKKSRVTFFLFCKEGKQIEPIEGSVPNASLSLSLASLFLPFSLPRVKQSELGACDR